MQLHRELPIQSKMRMCEVDRLGAVTAASVSGMVQRLDGSIMTEIPEHWYKLYTNGTKFRMMLSEIPLPGYNHIDKFYISTYEACISRSEGKLWSENLYAYSDGNSSLNNLRGGDNTSDWDGTYRSLLGRPVTNLTRTNSDKPRGKEAADGKCTPTTPTRHCSGYSPSSTPRWTARSLSTPRRTLTVSPKVA